MTPPKPKRKRSETPKASSRGKAPLRNALKACPTCEAMRAAIAHLILNKFRESCYDCQAAVGLLNRGAK